MSLFPAKPKFQTLLAAQAERASARRSGYPGRGHLLNVRAVAARLSVSTATVYKLCASGALVHVRVSNAIRVEPAELEAFKDRE